MSGIPNGLCGNKAEHEPHEVLDGSLAPYWCEADQSKRLPYAAERRQKIHRHAEQSANCSHKGTRCCTECCEPGDVRA